MLNNKEILKKSYETLSRITNKPDFEEVWIEVISYLKKIDLITESSTIKNK